MLFSLNEFYIIFFFSAQSYHINVASVLSVGIYCIGTVDRQDYNIVVLPIYVW